MNGTTIRYVDISDLPCRSGHITPHMVSIQIASLLKGKEMRGGATIETVNALGKGNGKQEYATKEQLDALKEHIKTYESPAKDLREPLRKIEQKLLTDHTGFLIGNQCLDFQKQDGITEVRFC
jgi:hypothetical protein